MKRLVWIKCDFPTTDSGSLILTHQHTKMLPFENTISDPLFPAFYSNPNFHCHFKLSSPIIYPPPVNLIF